MASSYVHFCPAFAAPAQQALRQKITDLADPQIDRPLFVNTLFAWDAGHAGPEHPPTGRAWFLLFDLHRVLLYDDPGTPGAPRIESIVRYLIDGYDFKRLDLLTQHFQTHPYLFFYPLDTLEILPTLWKRDDPQRLVILDLKTAQVRVDSVHHHPEASYLDTHPLVTPEDEAWTTRTPSEPLALMDRPVGDSLRIASTADVSGLISEAAGVIRAEELQQNQIGYLVSLTRLAWARGATEDFSGGRAFNREEATFVGRCEAAERFHIVFQRPGDALVYGAYEDVAAHAVDPEALFYPRLHADPTADNLARYAPSLPMYWTWAHHAARKEPALVPAQEFWFNTDRLPGEHACIQSSSNGCALGGCFEEAFLFALLEAIERDCYLTAWYLRRPCVTLDPDSVTSEPFHLLLQKTRHTYPNYDVRFFDITNDVGIPAVWAMGVKRSGTGGRTLHGASARLTTTSAMTSALQEMTAFFTFNKVLEDQRAHFQTILDDPKRVRTPDDHRGLYGLDEAFSRFNFLNPDPRAAIPVQGAAAQALFARQDAYNLKDVLERLVEHLHRLGAEVYVKDITHADFARRNLCCVRVAVTHLYPIYYGFRSMRVGLTERLRALSRTYTGRSVDRVDDLNLWPHPFS